MNGEQTPPQLSPHRYRVATAKSFDLGLIFSDALQMLKDGLRSYLGILLVLQLPLSILMMGYQPDVLNPHMNSEALLRLFVQQALFSVAGLFVAVNVYLTARRQLERRELSLIAVLGVAVFRYPYALVASLILIVVVFAGLLAFLIPGIIVYIYGSLFLPLILLRDRGIIAGFISSYELVKGYWWMVFVVEVIIFLMTLLISLPLGALAWFLEPSLTLQLVTTMVLGFFAVFARLVSVATLLNLESLKGQTVPTPADRHESAGRHHDAS